MVQEGWRKGGRTPRLLIGGAGRVAERSAGVSRLLICGAGRVAEKSSIHGSQGKAWFLDKNPG